MEWGGFRWGDGSALEGEMGTTCCAPPPIFMNPPLSPC